MAHSYVCSHVRISSYRIHTCKIKGDFSCFLSSIDECIRKKTPGEAAFNVVMWNEGRYLLTSGSGSPSCIVQASGKSAWYGVFSPTKFQSHDDIPCLSSSSTLQAICIVEFKGKETSAHQHFFPPSFSQQACCLHFHPTALIATYSHPRVLTSTGQGRPIWSTFQCIFHFFCCLGVKDLLLVQED
jgi:hypothetical protein